MSDVVIIKTFIMPITIFSFPVFSVAGVDAAAEEAVL